MSDPAAIRRVLLENCDNYEKDWLQHRVLSAGLTGGLLTAEGDNWRTQRRALAPLFARKAVLGFSSAMAEAAGRLVSRLARQGGRATDVSVEVTRVTLEVLERTIFSDGIGRDAEDIRLAMNRYFETVGRIDPFDMLGIPDFVPRPRRWKLRPALRLFESAVDTIISRRRERIRSDPDSVPRDILTFLLEAADPETGEPLSEHEVRANILTFIAAGHETTANCISWSLYLLSQSRDWLGRVHAEAVRAHAEPLGPERFLERHRDLAALRERVEDALALRDVGDGEGHGKAAELFGVVRRSVRGHEHGIAHTQRRVQHPVSPFGRHLRLRHAVAHLHGDVDGKLNGQLLVFVELALEIATCEQLHGHEGQSRFGPIDVDDVKDVGIL